MADAAYTPGPWFANGRYVGTKNHMSFVGECRNAAGNWSDDEPASANARLIAAAPELLKVAKLAADYIGDESAGSMEFWRAYNAAIAKALGQ